MATTPKSVALVLWICAWIPVASGQDTAPATTAPERLPTHVLTEFDADFGFAYGAFEKAVTVAEGVAHIQAKESRGGAGVNGDRDLGASAGRVPAMRLKVGPGNRSRRLQLQLSAGKARQSFDFPLDGAPAGEFVLVPAAHGLALRERGEGGTPFDLRKVTQFQVLGEWRSDPIDVSIDRIELVEQTAEMEREEQLQAEAEERRRAARARQLAEEEARRAALIRDGVPADPRGPRVVHVGAVDRDMLGVELQAGRVVLHPHEPYVPKPGDELRPDEKETVLAWKDRTIGRYPKGVQLKRDADGDGRKEDYAFVIQPYGNERRLLSRDELIGAHLTEETAGAPEAYVIRSSDDPGFTGGVHPTAVHRKSRPLDRCDVDGTPQRASVQHKLYLQLPRPLREGATYRIEFRGINVNVDSVQYRHEPRAVRSEAIHATHIGYRPSDGFKRAYLSLWLGTGGAKAYDGVEQFQLIDASGRPAFTGEVRLAFAADQPEALKDRKSYSRTHVYWMDFHELERPGTYRVLLEGIGTSYPFRISEGETWAEAFRTSMHGFLAHRSGIELGPPFTDYVRPRNMHPDDVPVFRVPRTRLEGESDAILAGFEELFADGIDESKLTVHRGAWGGYMDAGDWDRRSHHMAASYEHLELLELYPDFFSSFRLAVPPAEADNGLPDLMDEALYNIDLYRRLQEGHGGVGGGIESTSHPRPGEASWQESLLIGAFEPDPVTSAIYAACAAKAARQMARFDARRAEVYRSSAIRAFDWATRSQEAEFQRYGARTERFNPESARREAMEWRAAAAAELLWLTGDPRYDDAFVELAETALGNAGSHVRALFTYARLPDSLGDAAVRERCRKAVLQLADVGLEFQKGNAFQLTSTSPYLPTMGYCSYWSAPEMVVGPVIPRAYALTGDDRYATAAVAAAHYSAGANPMNLTMTTGVGHECPTGVLHMDYRASGQSVPQGITVYGQCDPAISWGFVDWAHTWYLSRLQVPGSREWPGHEAYVGLNKWPAVNEYTVHQSLRPTSYYWGFLAARPSTR